MALGEGLGRVFDVVPVAAGAPVNLENAAGVTFICTGADTFTVKNSGSHGGTFSGFSPITRYYNRSTTSGTTQWTDSGDLTTPVGSIVLASGTVAFYVGADDLPAGSTYVEVTIGTSGLVTAVLHDLLVQRTPKYLIAPNL